MPRREHPLPPRPQHLVIILDSSCVRCASNVVLFFDTATTAPQLSASLQSEGFSTLLEEGQRREEQVRNVIVTVCSPFFSPRMRGCEVVVGLWCFLLS
jgi:hypothetical protein